MYDEMKSNTRKFSPPRESESPHKSGPPGSSLSGCKFASFEISALCDELCVRSVPRLWRWIRCALPCAQRSTPASCV